MLNSRTVNNLYQKLNLQIPSPKTELLYNNNFQLLISVILTAQTTDKIVNLVTPILFNQYPDPKSIIQGGEKKIAYIIRKIGLAPTKAKHIIRTCKVLLEKHEGKIPGSREDLEKLPGVGRKTANVVLGNIFNQSALVVDTHVTRITNILGFVATKNAVKIEEKLCKIVRKKDWSVFAHLLIDHGRKVCIANRPKCNKCRLSNLCPSANLNF